MVKFTMCGITSYENQTCKSKKIGPIIGGGIIQLTQTPKISQMIDLTDKVSEIKKDTVWINGR